MESTTMKTLLLIFSSILELLGVSTGQLTTRFYFIHGGKTLWLSSTLQTSGFLLILIPLSISYALRKKNNTQQSTTQLFTLSPFLFKSSIFIGLVLAIVNYFYACGSSKLPVSTSSLIFASQLAFTAFFAFLLVNQKFSPYSVNTIVLLIVGPVVLALHGSSDMPEGETTRDYFVGFVMMGVSAVVYGFAMPLMELAFKKGKVQTLSYTIIMEFNLVVCVSATCFCLLGMLFNNDFKGIAREAREFELGEVKYYMVLICNAIGWQGSLLGVNGVVFCGSSLFSGILMALSITITEVLSVIIFHEKFQVDKGVALFLSLWGFVSYIYGDINYTEKIHHSSQDIETYQSTNESQVAFLLNQ